MKKIKFVPDASLKIKMQDLKVWIYEKEKVWVKDEDLIKGGLSFYHAVSKDKVLNSSNLGD